MSRSLWTVSALLGRQKHKGMANVGEYKLLWRARKYHWANFPTWHRKPWTSEIRESCTGSHMKRANLRMTRDTCFKETIWISKDWAEALGKPDKVLEYLWGEKTYLVCARTVKTNITCRTCQPLRRSVRKQWPRPNGQHSTGQRGIPGSYFAGNSMQTESEPVSPLIVNFEFNNTECGIHWRNFLFWFKE